MERTARRLLQAAELMYGHGLPYHNFTHACGVMERADALAQRVEQTGVGVNRGLIRLAAMGHDVLYVLVPETVIIFDSATGRQRPARTKEEVAAWFVRRYLELDGLPVAAIHAICDAIMATQVGWPIGAIEGRILAAADIAGMAAPYDDFRRDWELLRRESEMISGPCSTAVYAHRAITIIGRYCARRLCLTDRYFDRDGLSAWHRAVTANVFNQAERVWGPDRLSVVVELDCSAHPITSLWDNSGDCRQLLFLPVAASTRRREGLITTINVRAKATDAPLPLVVPVPLENGGISLPSGGVNRVYVAGERFARQDWGGGRGAEVRRIMRPDGTLNVYVSTQTPPVNPPRLDETELLAATDRLTNEGFGYDRGRHIEQTPWGYQAVLTPR